MIHTRQHQRRYRLWCQVGLLSVVAGLSARVLAAQSEVRPAEACLLVIDRATRQVIPGAAVRLQMPGSADATVADSVGNVCIPIATLSDSAVVRISAEGFASQMMTLFAGDQVVAQLKRSERATTTAAAAASGRREPIVSGAAPPSPTAVRVELHGMIRDERGNALQGVEVFAADGSPPAKSGTDGRYRLPLGVTAAGALITVRRLGSIPVYRVILTADGADIAWDLNLKSAQVLAKRIVRANSLHPALQSFRFDDFLERRERGVGQFFVAEEIWATTSMGDLINHASGISATFTYGNRIRDIRVPRCGPADNLVGVYLNGFEASNTGLDTTQTAQLVLSTLMPSAVVAVEIFRGRTEIPPEYMKPQYCAVIGVWTR